MGKIKPRLEKISDIPLGDNWAECEYFDVCGYIKQGCDAKNSKKECFLWNDWLSFDLKQLFEQNVDSNGNYLLKFR